MLPGYKLMLPGYKLLAHSAYMCIMGLIQFLHRLKTYVVTHVLNSLG